jgi:preprotein translocase subunit YajC
MGGGMMGRGLMGTVTEVAADHYTIKTEMGEVYTVHFSANTRIVKQPAGMRGPGGGGGGQGAGGGYGRGGNGGTPPQEIKATDIKVGDAIAAMGDIDATAKSVGATRIAQLDPDTAKRMQEMAANYGKTWLQGKVTAINETTITLTGALDNAPHTVVADENTQFRKRRDPITLADIQVGDSIRAEGAVKNGVFTATAVNDGGGMGGPPPNSPSGPPAGAPPVPPPSAPPQ